MVQGLIAMTPRPIFVGRFQPPAAVKGVFAHQPYYGRMFSDLDDSRRRPRNARSNSVIAKERDEVLSEKPRIPSPRTPGRSTEGSENRGRIRGV